MQLVGSPWFQIAETAWRKGCLQGTPCGSANQHQDHHEKEQALAQHISISSEYLQWKFSDCTKHLELSPHLDSSRLHQALESCHEHQKADGQDLSKKEMGLKKHYLYLSWMPSGMSLTTSLCLESLVFNKIYSSPPHHLQYTEKTEESIHAQDEASRQRLQSSDKKLPCFNRTMI